MVKDSLQKYIDDYREQVLRKYGVPLSSHAVLKVKKTKKIQKNVENT
jgi:hypothetical protein